MAPPLSRSSSASTPPSLAPSRRQSMRSHSGSYNPIYSASSSASSETSSIFSHASSSSSATSASTSHRTVSREVPRARTRISQSHRPAPVPSPIAPPPSISVPLCSPETGNTKFVLPRTLARPQSKTVSAAALAAVGADLENIPLPYILQSLKDIGPRMMAALARTTAPAPTSLPRDLDVRVAPDPDPDPALDTLPTHLLAVYARSNIEVSPAREDMVPRRKVTLFPTHAVMLAAHCAHLPPLPPGGKGTARESKNVSQVSLSQIPQEEGLVPDSANHGTTDDDMSQETNSEKRDLEHPGSDAGNHAATQESPPGDQQDMVDPPKHSLPQSFDPLASHIKLTLPVVPLCIPAPKMFSVLQAYLYTKRADHLLGALVPSPHTLPATEAASIPTAPPIPASTTHSPPESIGAPSPPASESDLTPRPSPAPSTPTPRSTPLPTLIPDAATLSAQLAAGHSTSTLVRSALRTHGVWADAAALGVFDERLWLTIDFAWRVLLGALERCAAQDVGSNSNSDSDSGDEVHRDKADEDETMHDEDMDDKAVAEKLRGAQIETKMQGEERESADG